MTKRDEMRPRPKLGRLSAREQRVVALVAEGMTNPEIGQALGCSTLTARNHVLNRLAEWAEPYGLVPLLA